MAFERVCGLSCSQWRMFEVPQRWIAYALLVVALAIGAGVRFHRLDLAQIDVDEGASWAGASAPGFAAVVASERRIDPGKLALYDLMLHGWIAVFGDGLAAMRAMSALLGTTGIVLVFLAVRVALRGGGGLYAYPVEFGEMAGALAALAVATNPTLVVSDRTARMYALLVAFELAQVIFFLHALRAGTRRRYAGLAAFSAVAVATNFSAIFLLFAEGVWLIRLLSTAKARAAVAPRAVLFTALSVAIGVAMLLPLLLAVASSTSAAVRGGIMDWVKPRPASWAFTILEQWTGHTLIAPLAALAGFGAWYRWRGVASAPAFFSVWLLAPIIAVAGFSWAVMPLMVPRYLLCSLVAFFALAALGAASIPSRIAVIALAAALAFVSLQRIHRRFGRPQGPQWREAAAIAGAAASDAGKIAVVPDYAADAVRYCMSPETRRLVFGFAGDCGSARAAIVDVATYIPAAMAVKSRACYPRVVARLRQVEVRAR